MRRLLFLALTLVVIAAGCSDDGDAVETSGTVDPDTPVSSPDEPVTVDTTSTPWERIEPTLDLVNPVVATPDELVPDPEDPNAVLVHFYGGVEPCNGARVTVLEQGAGQVRLRLELGTPPDAGDQVCIEIAVAQELKVVLDAPLAGREVVAEPGAR
jgi:hypothetical protein